MADATDDGGACASAQRVRSAVGALTSVNEQLGSAKGLVGTAVSALGKISDSINTAKALLMKIGDNSITQDSRDQYVASCKSLVSQAADYVDDSAYNGQSLLGKVAGGATALKGEADQLTRTGADSNRLDATITFNSSKIDSLNAGLGALVDTGLSKESAKLQALQIKQQLGILAGPLRGSRRGVGLLNASRPPMPRQGQSAATAKPLRLPGVRLPTEVVAQNAREIGHVRQQRPAGGRRVRIGAFARRVCRRAADVLCG